MVEWFQMGGVMMWPILVCALLVLGLAVRASLSLGRGTSARPARVLSAADAVLFWGGLGAVFGVLGTVVGAAQMAGAIERAGAIQASTLWAGIGVALITSIAGMVILIVALLLWMALRSVYWSRHGAAGEL
jgi:biopolymer transport protein ExbB/TolQ